MTAQLDRIRNLFKGPLPATNQWPVSLVAKLCDLRPRMIPKGRVARGYRAVARNGRVLLASDLPLADLVDRRALLRLQTWHRVILPGDPPEPYGILVCIRAGTSLVHRWPLYETRFVSHDQPSAELALEVGGGMMLEFFRE